MTLFQCLSGTLSPIWLTAKCFLVAFLASAEGSPCLETYKQLPRKKIEIPDRAANAKMVVEGRIETQCVSDTVKKDMILFRLSPKRWLLGGTLVFHFAGVY